VVEVGELVLGLGLPRLLELLKLKLELLFVSA
jgi:hypothetical protein